jgi:hypothetical protein
MAHTPTVFRPELSASTSLSQRCFFLSLSFYFTNEIIRYLGRRWNGGGETPQYHPHAVANRKCLSPTLRYHPYTNFAPPKALARPRVPLCLHFPLMRVSRSILPILPLTDMSDKNDNGDDGAKDDDGDERRSPLARMDPNQRSQ